MPGLVIFRRRWSVGSDDLIVPGIFLFTVHLVWLIILCCIVIVFNFDIREECVEYLWIFNIGYICVLCVALFIEVAICTLSMRGSILNPGPREFMRYWLYARVVLMLIDVGWLILGTIWLAEYYLDCPIGNPKDTLIGTVVCNWVVNLTMFVTVWCTFDPAGRSWVKMKKYQRSMRETESRFNYKRSGTRARNWRQRKVIRAYQDSWNHRCRLLFCCMGSSDRNRNSFADIARLLSDFFRELDVVPSDVVAGLVLLRKFQKLERTAIIRQRKNDTYDFLSGVPITPRSQFLALNDNSVYEFFQCVIHYMHYALSAYGWPMLLITNKAGLVTLCPHLACCNWCCGKPRPYDLNLIDDNCCSCNYAALKHMLNIGEIDVVYCTYHVEVGETPFFIAVDYTHRKIVISIRGTLSMQDILTDLNAESEVLPVEPVREDWLGHKGMIQAAIYIKNLIERENLIEKAQMHDPDRDTHNYGLVLVGHSLGAGTASILAILLKQKFPELECYSYSPPGGLLSLPAVEYSKSFITSVIVGKDVVPRIGLYQMESLRADLINAITRSVDPKWKTIACSVICCCCGPEPTSVTEMSSKDSNINRYNEQRTTARQSTVHPNDNSIALTLHNPLYPPGRIIHVVRHHQSENEHKYEKSWRQMLNNEPVYQAIWTNNTDYDEVIISPVMLQDHMPDKVLDALKKVVTTFGLPKKPTRQQSTTEHVDGFYDPSSPGVFMETSFPCFDQTSPVHDARTVPTLLNGSLASSLRGSQLSSIYHSMDNESSHGGVGKSTSEATTVQLNRTFINYNDTLSQSNPSSSTLTLNNNHQMMMKKHLTLNDTRLKKIYSVTGMAPLASPESLSEMSSVSSLQNGNGTPCDEYPSQMHTPKILRRAPKISAPLSNIDWQTIQEYEKLGKVFYTNNKVPSEEEDFYQQHEVSKSDNSLDNGVVDPRLTSTNFNLSDSAIDREIVSSSGTYVSAVSSLSGIYPHGSLTHSNSKLLSKLNSNSVAFEEEEYYMSRVTPEGVIESHFPVFYDLTTEPPHSSEKQNNCRYENTNINEALPLLANLNERTGVSFVRRKNYVYPMQSGTPVHQRQGFRTTSSPNTSSPRSSKSSQSIGKNESSV